MVIPLCVRGAAALWLLATANVLMASPSIREIVELTDVDGVSVSPAGRYVVFRTVKGDVELNSYDLRWHSFDTQTGIVRDLGSGGMPVYKDPGLIEEEQPVWLSDGSFAFRALIGGAIAVWQAEPDGSKTHPLIVRDADVEEVQADPRGRGLIYQLGPSRQQIERAERQEYDEGIRVDGSVDLAQNLFRGGSINGRMANQRFAGYWVIRTGLLSHSPRQKFRFDLVSRTDQPIGSPQIPGPFVPPTLGAAASAKAGDGSQVEARWDGASGKLSARLNDGRTIICERAECRTHRIAWLAWRPRKLEVVVGFIDRSRRQSLGLWDLRTGDLRTISASDGLLSGDRWSYTPCAISTEAAFCVSASAASPPHLDCINLQTGRRDMIFDPNASLRLRYHPLVEQLSIPGRNGKVFAAVVMSQHQSSSAAGPLFVNYYKCDGFLRGGEGDEWPLPSLLDAGFVVACINAASSTGPQDAIQTYRDGLEGVRALVQVLRHRGLVDPTKVAIGGFSFGSQVATWIAMYSNIAAAVSIASVQLEPTGYWLDALGTSDRTKTLEQVWRLGKPDKSQTRWKLVSPAMNAERIRAPLLMQLPEQEARRMPELAAKLMMSTTPAELFAYPDEDHVKIQPRHRLSIYDRNLDWFRFWLQGYIDPDPAKAEQYRRWRAMRARKNPSAEP